MVLIEFLCWALLVTTLVFFIAGLIGTMVLLYKVIKDVWEDE